MFVITIIERKRVVENGEREVEIEIFKQTVEKLDVKAVINAINYVY